MTTTISHHPDDATLFSFVAATLAEPLAAVVSVHLSLCPRCRAEVADLELFGAAVMLLSPRPSDTAPVRVPKQPANVVTSAVHQPGTQHGRLPAPIARLYNLSLDTVPWKRLGPGVWHHRLPLQQESAGDLRLLRIAPGRKMPDHGHGGAELTLVIEGAYSDVTGAYRRGDIQDVDQGIEHQPIVDMGAECVCLIASEHPARFKSVFGRLLQPWTGM